MSTYCISDIHGEIDRYHAMLDLVRFSQSDTLYVIGDVIDRAPGGVDILLDIMKHPNVTMLMGNHELMCLNTLGPNQVFGARNLWRDNGGGCTYRELLYHVDAATRNRVLCFLASLPWSLDIEVCDRAFHLVHGYPCTKRIDCLWARPILDAPAPVPGATTIIGHTPTPFLTNNWYSPFRIWYGNGVIDIDCGCGNETPMRRLACLRLEDMAEFYV